MADGEAGGRKGDILEGIGGSPGRVVGIARIVMDASDPDALNPGDILVAPITDPSFAGCWIGTIARGIRQFVCFGKLKIENTEASSTVSALNSRPALAEAFGDYSNGYYFPETPH